MVDTVWTDPTQAYPSGLDRAASQNLPAVLWDQLISNLNRIAGADGKSSLMFPTLLADSGDLNGLSTVTFSSIPQTYRALLLEVIGRSTVVATSTALCLRMNGDTAANYDAQNVAISGTTVAASEGLAGTSINNIGSLTGASAAAGLTGVARVWMPDYAGTTWHKSAISQGGVKIGTASGNVYATQGHGSWRSTAAVTSLTAFPASGNYAAGSRIRLFGLP